MAFRKNKAESKKFDKITICLSSPDDILERSFGEVKKPETINYRTYKPEMEGLFCERIFGPTKDYECYCGKYKRIRYKGIVCDRCGVEVTEKKVRRDRMGHIKLVVPVVHIWYFKSLPNKIGYLLGVSSKVLESIIYYEKYCVIQPGKTAEGVTILNEKDEEETLTLETINLISEEQYLSILDKEEYRANAQLSNDDPNKFIALMGAEAVKALLERIDLDQLAFDLKTQATTETSRQRKAEALKRLKVVNAFKAGNEEITNRPEWMVIDYLPIIPPELRPLVPLDGGRFASSDLNDLYRRVIIRNNRLKRLIEIKAPEVILRNEKRMLQESVDSLFDNSRKSNAVKAEGGRALKSLSDVLKGKQGRFRQNLLGKRVDYSGRSVIVVGPNLKLHQCGLPKGMAAELFKPFIIRKLIERGIVKTVKSAKKLVDRQEPVIWDILENVLKGHPVLLNRAPTLHRLSIQAFMPTLIEGKAIRLHPLVCSAFNADFDGDQMAVHVPLSNEAILEAQMLMLSSHNILNPQNGTPIALPSQDMVLGLYYITNDKKSTKEEKVKGEGSIFYSDEEAMIAFNEGRADMHAIVKVRTNVRQADSSLKMEIVETTVGRILFNQAVPKSVGYINEHLSKGALKKVIGKIIEYTDLPTTVEFLDAIKEIGFKWAFKGGLSFNINDVIIPEEKVALTKSAQAEVETVAETYGMGLITERERYNQVIDIWTRMDNKLSTILMNQLSADKQGFNSMYMMLDSGARGSKAQIKQLGALRGLMAKPRKSGTSDGGDVIENPILANFREGLSVLEYFISTHGARKGLADTALKTADAGYLTRRLVDVAQDAVINIEDCGTLRGVTTSDLKNGDQVVVSMEDRIEGRIVLFDLKNPVTEELIIKGGEEITKEIAAEIREAGIERVDIRSVLTCEAKRGVCVKCYGRNLTNNRMAEKGDAVGIIAAQSIGEPGTQLTLRTFHVGGVASVSTSESKIETSFDGVLEFNGVRTVDLTNKDGEKQQIVIGRTGEVRLIKKGTKTILNTIHVPYGSILFVKDGEEVKKGQKVCEWDPFNNVIVSTIAGKVEFIDLVKGISVKEEMDDQTGFNELVVIQSKDKKVIPAIQIVPAGSDEPIMYNLPVGAHVSVKSNAKLKAGEVIAKIPRDVGSLKDITGGLPRVTELFEARNPSNPAVVSEIEGIVKFGGIKRGNRELIIEAKDGMKKKYLVKLSKHILVQDNDYVKSGMSLSDGAMAPRDILEINGPKAVQQYIVNEVQDVYRLQGIPINDKHVEVIVRQMMSKVTVTNQGDSDLLENEAVDKVDFLEENDRIFDKKVITDVGSSEELKIGQIVSLRKIREENSKLKRNGEKVAKFRDAIPATASPMLQGITKSSLSTFSWISAASFQETTKVLSTSAIAAKVDNLKGLKENVIVGKKIPAGTGLPEYNNLNVISKEEVIEIPTVEEQVETEE